MAYFEGHPNFLPTNQKHIIMACLALHNFIRDSYLCDKEFARCDANENYTTDTSNDESEDVENDDTMDTLRTRIVDALGVFG
uniref:DDE Tnp4 domain-containing protein n=1 Tax=Oryza brachyantha TaxID=4533 RepID=J3MEF3_ORYBR